MFGDELGFWGVGFRVWCLGFWGLGRDWGLRFRDV